MPHNLQFAYDMMAHDLQSEKAVKYQKKGDMPDIQKRKTWRRSAAV